MNPVIIIPVLNPDEKLISLAAEIRKNGFEIIIVSDGSEPEYDHLFDILKLKYGCIICSHAKNEGKGNAIKTAIRYACENFTDSCGYVTADADGQHLTKDIIKVSSALKNNPRSIILGVRDFNKNDIPIKSKLGNRLTSFVFLLSTKKRCQDTQTGLRALPSAYTELYLNTPGKRYEYEMNLLLAVARNDIEIKTVPISVVYTDNNSSTHFRALRDSFLIYINIIKYSLSSLLSAVTDLSLFALLANFVFGTSPSGLLLSTSIARITSGSINFILNKYWVFNSESYIGKEFVKYSALFCMQMLTSWALVALFEQLPLPLIIIKVFVDLLLFFISYFIQKKYIFKRVKIYAKN